MRRHHPKTPRRESELNCQCGHRTKFSFKKASMFQCVNLSVTCEHCESVWGLKLKKMPHGKDYYDTAIKCEEMSQKLADIMKEKAEKSTKTTADKALKNWNKERENGQEEVSAV